MVLVLVGVVGEDGTVLRKVTLEAADTAADPRPETRLGRFTLEALPEAEREARRFETGLDHENRLGEELEGECFGFEIREGGVMGDFLRGDLGGSEGRERKFRGVD